MNLGRKGFCVYAALVGAAALVVVNPIVVGFFLPYSDLMITAYLAALDLALLTIIGLSLIHFGTGRPLYFYLSVAGVVSLPFAMAFAELAVTFSAVKYYNDRNAVLSENVHRPDPVLGWSLVPNAVGHHVAGEKFDVFYRFDEKGRKTIPRTEGLSRTLHFFGDSFIFGYGVANEATALNLLAANNRDRFNVLNYGVSGYGLEQMFIRLRASARDIEPGDIVVFAPSTLDLERNLIDKTFVCGTHWENESENPAEVYPVFRDGRWDTVRVDEECNLIETLLLHSRFHSLPLGLIYDGLRGNDFHRKIIDNADRIFAEAAKLTRRRGARFLLILLVWPQECEEKAHFVNVDLLKASHVSLMPRCPESREELARSHFPDDIHWNPEGNRWAALVLDKTLFEEFPDLKSVAAH